MRRGKIILVCLISLAVLVTMQFLGACAKQAAPAPATPAPAAPAPAAPAAPVPTAPAPAPAAPEPTSSGRVYNLKLNHWFSSVSAHGKWLQMFADKLAEESKGRLKIRLYAS